MCRLRLTALCAATILLTSLPAAHAQDLDAVTGMYACEGVSPDGEPYRALLELVSYGEHVRARWLFRDSPPVLGLGMVRHGVLAISYFGSGPPGLVIYRVGPHGISIGEWVIAGAGGVYRETVRKLPPHPPDVDDPTPPREREEPAALFDLIVRR
jgi:hypothetical protein